MSQPKELQSPTPPSRRDLDAAWQREVESLSEYKAMKEPYAGLVRAAFERGYLARCFAPSEIPALVRCKHCGVIANHSSTCCCEVCRPDL